MLRRDAKVKRNVTAIVPASWQRLFAVHKRVTNNIAKSQETMQRFMQYQEAVDMTPAQARNALHELALTIGVHEWTLGVIPQSSGDVFLPKRMNIKCVQITDILGYHRGDQPDPSFEKIVTLTQAMEHRIKPLIKSLKFEGRVPTAVIVVEHRNLKKGVRCLGENQEEIVLIMTGGYPSTATREFLHMLAKDKRLARAPFLYFGDHDFQGVDIYKVLKTGSAQQAESNRTMVCPRLQWVGPTRQDLIDSPKKGLESQRKQYKAGHPRASDKDVDTALQRWKADKAQKVQRKFQAATTTDRRLMKSFEKSGWLTAEPEMAAELEEMLAKNSKFRLADMTEVNPDYLSVFIDAKVADFCTQRQKPRAPLGPILTPERQEWLAAQSQSQGRSSSLETLRASTSAPLGQQSAAKKAPAESKKANLAKETSQVSASAPSDEQALSKEDLEALMAVHML